MKTSPEAPQNGYELFIKQGKLLKQKSHKKVAKKEGRVTNALTSVNSAPVSIEGIVIEKIEAKNRFNNLKTINTNDLKRSINRRRIVNNTGFMFNGELSLPKEVLDLVDNKMYLPRHNKLARDYGVSWLIKLAELSKTKAKPSHWYAKCTSTKNWEQTEQMLMDLFKRIDKMKEKLEGLGVSNKWITYYVGASKKLSEAKFNRCIELARSRGANKPQNLLAVAIKNSLSPNKAQLS